MVDYRRKINAFRDVKSCEDYINLARLNNNHNAVSYAKRKIITLKYQELLSELLSDFEIEIRSQIKESLIDGLSSGNYEKR
tara:strand:+ start:960 stop:1202 length:243 start_codon:yes stop_codon:yes gene_type:complete